MHPSKEPWSLTAHAPVYMHLNNLPHGAAVDSACVAGCDKLHICLQPGSWPPFVRWLSADIGSYSHATGNECRPPISRIPLQLFSAVQRVLGEEHASARSHFLQAYRVMKLSNNQIVGIIMEKANGNNVSKTLADPNFCNVSISGVASEEQAGCISAPQVLCLGPSWTVTKCCEVYRPNKDRCPTECVSLLSDSHCPVHLVQRLAGLMLVERGVK